MYIDPCLKTTGENDFSSSEIILFSDFCDHTVSNSLNLLFPGGQFIPGAMRLYNLHLVQRCACVDAVILMSALGNMLDLEVEVWG